MVRRLCPAPVEAVQCLGHAVADQRVDLRGLGPLQEFGHLGGLESVAVQARFQALQTKCGEHQQRRDESHEEPGHENQVNTTKVSAGSRNATVSTLAT